MVAALRAIGIDVEHDIERRAVITVQGCAGTIPSRAASLYVANSGTSLRFLTAMLATGVGTFHLDGTPRMRQRPISDLLVALNRLGAVATSDLGTGCPPVTIEASGLDWRRCVRERRRLEPVPERSALMALPCATGDNHRRGPGRPGVPAVRRHDSGGDGGVRSDGRQPQVPPLRRPARPLQRLRIRHRARRVGRQLLLRPGRHDGGDGHCRRAGHLEHSRRHGVRGRARTHGLHRHARADANHGHRRPACAQWTST